MSSDKNLLKKLLQNLLDERLKKLEKKYIEEAKDINFTKLQYKNLNAILSNIKIKKPENNKIKRKFDFNDFIYNKSELIKYKESPNLSKFKLSPKYYKKSNNQRKALTPAKTEMNYWFTTENWTKKPNNKYKYVKSRYMDESNYINKSNVKRFLDNRKLFLTPKPRMVKKKKKIILNDKINIKTKKLNLNKINIETKRNINSLKREKDYKKNTIVSNIELESDEINFVLKELKKEKKVYNSEEENENEDSDYQNKNNSSYNSENSNNSGSQQIYNKKNKDIIKQFGKYINSTDGHNIVKLIGSFLDKKTKYNFFSCSKNMINNLILYLNYKYNKILSTNKIISINSIEKEITDLKNKYSEEGFDSPKYSFQLSKNSLKSIEILDDIFHINIFKTEELKHPLDNIIFVYRLFMQLINKEEITQIKDDKIFWSETRNYFLENCNNKVGSFIKEYVSEFDFTNENIYKLKKLSSGKEDKLKITNYENICQTTGLITFIIKDALEYCGVIYNEKKTMPGITIGYLEYILEKLKECKEYLDLLKSYK